jgi:hypothetical protein
MFSQFIAVIPRGLSRFEGPRGATVEEELRPPHHVADIQELFFSGTQILGLRQSDDTVLRRLLALMKKKVAGGRKRHIIRSLGGFSLYRIQ